jgi:hypothetical protein
MTDVILVATIVAFFAAAALLVRSLGFVVADSANEGGPDDAAREVAASWDADQAGPLSANDGRPPR